tara:strand:+ start:3589 stop:5028 length:1440 start_codon:yes stop_codon:yes gene_type:complete
MDKDTKKRAEGIALAMNALQGNSSSYQGRAGIFGSDSYGIGQDPKHHCLWDEFGYKTNLNYNDFRNMYERQGIAGGAIEMKAEKAFEAMPVMVEGDDDAENKKESANEKEFRLFDKRLGLFNTYMDCTIRRSVGNYSALILQIADNKLWNEKAESVNADQIVKVIPVWEHQLTVNEYDQDQQSETYGDPLSFTYQEYDFNRSSTQNAAPQRSVNIHASRVVWFGDLYSNGSEPLLGNLMLKKGYNDFVTLEKLIGAGGEGAYKNAARHIAASFDKDTSIGDLMKLFGVEDAAELGDVFQEMTQDLNSNFDAGMFGKAVDYQILSTSLPDMRDTFDNALTSAASSVKIPASIVAMKISGERASTQDQLQFAKNITSYRNLVLTPEILRGIMAKLSSLGIWQGVEWSVCWDSLLDASEADKIDNAYKMAQTNQASVGTGEFVYTQKEIRVAGGQKAEVEISEAEQMLMDEGEGQDPLPEGE